MAASGRRFALPRQTEGFENLRRAVLRQVVRGDDLHRVAASLFGERPETGRQPFFLVAGDDRHGRQRPVRLSFGEFRAHFGDGLRGDFGEGLFIDREVFRVPFHAIGVYTTKVALNSARASDSALIAGPAAEKRPSSIAGRRQARRQSAGGESSGRSRRRIPEPRREAGKTALRRRFSLRGCAEWRYISYFCGSKRVFYVACQRHSLGGSLLVDIRTGPAVHPAVAGRGLFVVRGPDLPLGGGVVVSGSLRPAGGMRFPPREARTGHGVPAEPVPRRDVVEPGDRLSEHRQRGGLDDSLHVSAGRGPS